MKNNIESQFEYARQRLSLSASEKALHRAELIKFMQEGNNKPVRSPVSSPFSIFLFSGARFALAALVLMVTSGAGVVFAAEKSLPGDTFYAVKIKFTEPVQLALMLDEHKKADLQVKLVDRRLKEISEVAITGDVDPGAFALASESLVTNINAAQAHVADLQSVSENTDEALETASDLQAILTAHEQILDKVQATAPDTEGIQEIAATVTVESNQTDAIVASTTEAVENSTSISFAEPSDSQQDDTLESLENIKADIASALSSFDASDREDVNTAIAEIDTIIAQAQEKDGAGDIKGAYLLYTAADEKISELKTLIQADQQLGVDVIDVP